MQTQLASLRSLLLAGGVFAALGSAASAAEVTYERLANPDKEPQNWLMVHRSYDAQRFSPLTAINKTNVKGLRLLFAVAIGGTTGNESVEATPLVEDGFMYIVDHWGVVYKIDVRSGTSGRILWGNLVISVAPLDGRVIATDKETGKVAWDKNLHDQPDLELTAAPLALKDSIIVGASGGDRGVRDWIASLDPKTGNLLWKTYSVPAPGEPGSETWKDKNNAWQTGGGAFYVTGSYDPATNLTYWGSGNPVPGYDASYRPGDNLYTASALAFDAATGKIAWHFQYTPNDNHDYDETGTHILIDAKVNGEDRKIVSHAGRNGFNYVFDRNSGQFINAVPYSGKVTWTKGIDAKTGKPVDYDPNKDVQNYAEAASVNDDKATRTVCPNHAGANNHFPATYSRNTKLIYIPGVEGCDDITNDHSRHVKGKFDGGGYVSTQRLTSSVVAVDPTTGQIKMRKELPYTIFGGTLSTAGGIVMTGMVDGTLVAMDDQTLAELWSINLGTGFDAPPMTYAVDGKQYIAIASGLFRNARNTLSQSPEMRNLSNASMIFVFGL
jgi:alcohol dehydrogenase (cytochrome c)